jgi:hypothetical protein
MKKKTALFGLLGVLVLLAMSVGILTAFSGNEKDEFIVEVTITNLTRGQTMTSFFVARHDGSATPLYSLGQTASDGLAAMAEDGSARGLLETWNPDSNSNVGEARTAGGLLRPGQSVTIEFIVSDGKQLLSLASMLVSTNDGFVGANSLDLSSSKVVYLNVYDAGSEGNSESCDFVPGPPCGSHNARDTQNAEGFVHVHAGIHGDGGLSRAQHDWRNPAAKLEIKTWKRV